MAEKLRTLAESVTSELFQSLLAQEAGAFSGDIEAVHDMRVISRRLRVVLSNFAVCYLPEGRRQARTLLAGLADALGAVRDLDVMIELLKTRRAEFPADQQQAIGRLLRRYQSRRLHQRKQLQHYLQGADYALLKTEFSLMLRMPPSSSLAEITQASSVSNSMESEADGKGIQGEEGFAG